MKFSTVVAIVAEEHEDTAIDIAKANGAGGVTILNGRGLGLGDKTTFFGLTYERADSVLIFVMEKWWSSWMMRIARWKNAAHLKSSRQ